jgi:CheY-like chemotaxis protein
MFTPAPIPPRVLVVQADTLIRLSFLDLLTEEGYDAFGAASLPEALALLDQHLFDLILADL